MKLVKNLRKIKITSIKRGFILSHPIILPVLFIGDKFGIWKMINLKLKLNIRERGYTIAEKIASLVSLLASGGNALDHIEMLRREKALSLFLSMENLPAPTTLGETLRKIGEHPLYIARLSRIISKVINRVIERRGLKRITFDLDASLIESYNRGARFTYKGFKGYDPIFIIIDELRVIYAGVFREGNVPPHANNLSLLRLAYFRLPESLRRLVWFRSDSAGYQVEVMRFLDGHGVPFCIGVDMDAAVKGALRGIKEEEWEEYEEGAWVAETVHVVGNNPRRMVGPFRLVFLRREIGEGLFGREYKYFGVITNLPREEYSAEEVMRWYDGRGRAENVFKEMKYDIGMRRMPLGGFMANAAYMQVLILTQVLFRLMQMEILPGGWEGYTVKTMRFLLSVGVYIVRHGRRIWMSFPRGYGYRVTWERMIMAMGP